MNVPLRYGLTCIIRNICIISCKNYHRRYFINIRWICFLMQYLLWSPSSLERLLIWFFFCFFIAASVYYERLLDSSQLWFLLSMLKNMEDVTVIEISHSTKKKQTRTDPRPPLPQPNQHTEHCYLPAYTLLLSLNHASSVTNKISKQDISNLHSTFMIHIFKNYHSNKKNDIIDV